MTPGTDRDKREPPPLAVGRESQTKEGAGSERGRREAEQSHNSSSVSSRNGAPAAQRQQRARRRVAGAGDHPGLGGAYATALNHRVLECQHWG
jgi:hypothetical protein